MTMNIFDILKKHIDKQLHFLWLFFITTTLIGFIPTWTIIIVGAVIIFWKEGYDGRWETDTRDTMIDVAAGLAGISAALLLKIF